MSKQYRVSLSTSRLELTQVLARLQEDTLEEPDRQLLMRLVQQLLGSSGGTPGSGPPAQAGIDLSELVTGSFETASPEQENKESKRLGHGRRSVETTPGRSASLAMIRSDNQAIVVRVAGGCIRPARRRCFSASPVSPSSGLPVLSKPYCDAPVASNGFRLRCPKTCRRKNMMPRWMSPS